MVKNRKFLSERTDISMFLTHLTRDNESGTARENLISIITQTKLEARGPHCLFSPLLEKESKRLRDRFSTVCLTETPVTYIKSLLGIEYRQKKLKPYGLIFRKSDLVKKHGANPVFYVYNSELENYFLGQYRNYIDRNLRSKLELKDFPKFGALINKVGDNYDFHWEREWRVRGDMEFELHDIFAVIAPSYQHERIQEELGEELIYKTPFIDPKWNSEKILERVAIQMCRPQEGE